MKITYIESLCTFDIILKYISNIYIFLNFFYFRISYTYTFIIHIQYTVQNKKERDYTQDVRKTKQTKQNRTKQKKLCYALCATSLSGYKLITTDKRKTDTK